MSTLETTSPPTQPTFPASNGSVSFSQYWSDLEDRVRRQPNQYLAIALLVGFLLRNLPIGAFLGLIVRLVGVLIKPALVILAVANLWRLISERQQAAPLVITPDSPGAAS